MAAATALLTSSWLASLPPQDVEPSAGEIDVKEDGGDDEDRRTAATPLVVERAVRTKLRMFATNPSVTHYVTDAPASTRSVAVPSASSAAAVSGARP